MTTTTATNFRSNVKKYLDLVINDSQEVIISRGSESAVLIPLDQFNSIKETEFSYFSDFDFSSTLMSVCTLIIFEFCDIF